MAEKLVVVARMTTLDSDVRDKFIQKLQAVSETALATEPGTLKYCILVPREDDGKSLYMIEEYADQAAFDTHMATDGVKALIQWISEGSVNDPAGPSSLDTFNYVDDFYFSRESITSHSDPHCLFAELDYIPGGIETSLPYWKAVVETGRESEPGTMVYGIMKDLKKELRLCTIEAYESPEYLMEVHVPSKAIQASIANTKHLRTGLKHHVLKKKGGFLYRK